jgi:DNA transposition AAA+ family ATPase
MSESKPMDRLREGQRIMGATRVIRDGQDVNEAIANQVIANTAAFIRSNGSSWAKVARAIGYSAPTLSAVANSKYAGDWRQIILDLDVWLEDEMKRMAGPARAVFVPTRMAEEIFVVAEAACHLKTIAVIYGEASSGFGKTMALRAFAEQKPGTIFVSVETVCASPVRLSAEIGRAMNVTIDADPRRLPQWHRAMKDSLRGTPRLLIVDEIHKLCAGGTDGSLHFLRDLHDQTGIPMLWCGTKDLVAYLERRQSAGREPLAQIRSRIGICRDVTERAGGGNGGGDGGGDPLFTTDEIRRVFDNQKMRLAPDAARYLYELANLADAGALRVCSNLLKMAIKINERHADTLTAAMLRGAHQLLIDRKTFAMLATRLDEQKPRQAARAVPA